MASIVVCEYEPNRPRNETVMTNDKVLYKYLTLKKVNVKVNTRFVCYNLKY